MTTTTRRHTTDAAQWRTHAACQTADPDLFFPTGDLAAARIAAEHAKRICRACPVTQQCLAWALKTRQDAGVWGGMDERERRNLHRRQVRSGRSTDMSAVDHILLHRLDEYRQLVAQGLRPGEIARRMATNVQTVNNVRSALAQQRMADAAMAVSET